MRHGTTTLFAALDVATGRVEQACLPRHRHQEFLRFLKQVAKAYPRRELHIVCDNYATHKHPTVKAWLARHPRITLHFTPTSGSWLNMVEIFFGIITRQAIRRGSFDSVRELIDAIRRFIDGLKADCVPSLLAKSYCNSAVQLLMAGGARQVNMDDLFTITYLRTVDDYLAFMLHLLEPDPKALVPDTAESGAPVTELLQRIYTCIADSYDDCSFSLQDVAAKLDLSSGYLSQYFKQQTGDTLTSYVADLRIRKACSLLESTTMPLQMVSESVGYYNLNSFIRRFKQITGLTPGEYRKTRQ